jgi:CRISPR-associated endonuclease/helicase Cas3
MQEYPLAHSARRDRGIPPQLYSEHIRAVSEIASRNAEAALFYRSPLQAGLRPVVDSAALYHDLGKLEPENQAVLATKEHGGLAVNHVDAGAAQLCSEGRWEAALLAYGPRGAL